MGCDSCDFFISHVTVIDGGFEIWGYGCELGGSYLDNRTFSSGCINFKSKE